jgi:hypothetical protein
MFQLVGDAKEVVLREGGDKDVFIVGFSVHCSVLT